MDYEFTYDWFSWNIENFSKHLSGLAGAPITVLEIGCHEGRSTTWLLDHVLTHEDSRIICADLEPAPRFAQNIRSAGGEHKVDLRVGRSRDILRTLPADTFDFVYIDGSHWTVDVIEDAVHAFRLAKAGSLIAFDDYEWDDPQFNQFGCPKPAVDAFLELYSRHIEVVEHGHQVWIRKLSD